MRPIRRIPFASYKSSVVELRGGINENVSSLELMPGELADCRNYMIAEGGYGGYTSIKGYERYDGKGKPSEEESYNLTLINASNGITDGDTLTATSGTYEALEDGRVISGSYVGGDAEVQVQVRLTTGSFNIGEVLSVGATPVGTLHGAPLIDKYTDELHAGLEKRRSEVIEVPGEGNILGVHIYKGLIYTFRKKTGVNQIGMYVEDATSGWLEVDTSGDPLLYDSTKEHNFRFSNYNFSANTDALSMYWVDGHNKCRAYDGTTVTTITNANMTVIGDSPTHVIAFNNHLHLVYQGGSLQISTLGDPTDWTTSPTEIGTGSIITNLVVGVQNSLIIYMERGIKVLTGTSSADFQLSTFSQRSGAREDTAVRLLGTHFFLDDRGLTTLEATDMYGDYSANSISQRFKQTLLSPVRNSTVAFVSRDLNQYRICFDDRIGIIVSFEGKEFRGATFTEFDRIVSHVSNDEDTIGAELIVFSSNGSGYVYIMDSGTSFDGTAITTRMSTSFYHYGSPRQYKGFKRLTMEIAGDRGQEFNVKVVYDYDEPDQGKTIWYTPQVYVEPGSAVYGTSKWGIMRYGASVVATNRVPVYINGVATNVSFKVISNETYRSQHIIQNFIVDFNALNRRI